ncbi:choice-of-anchor X domain-containing protein [Promineifilum sp.]|uniref:choice-of-anchor X domain-containing protein n=1 Tax=Promineifilum sp. TaxID=2664178 RepID=UPI0035B234EC
MSTAKSSKPDGSKKNADPAKPESGKKSKSTGFLESSGFKPTWLETGPLSPDGLPDPILIDQSQLTADEFAALQEELQRLYSQEAREEATDAEQPATPPAADVASSETAAMEGAPGTVTAEAAAPDEHLPAPLETAILPEPESTTRPIETAILDAAAVFDAPEPEPTQAPDLPPSPLSEEPDGALPLTFPQEPQESTTHEPRVARPRRGPQFQRSRSTVALLTLSLLLLATAALIYFVNPFTRLALGMASLARPAEPAGVAPPRSADREWCLQGEFLDGSAAAPRLLDDGTGGDVLARDGVYSLDYTLQEPGVYHWQVVNCVDASLVYPTAPAWVTTDQPGPVTFVFDSNESADRLFFPIPFVVSAIDDVTDYRLIGNFQEWNPDDTSGRLEPISSGLYQQVRRMARPGSYEGYVIANGDPDLAIDAYGRTTEPIPFSFETQRNGEYIIFLVDIDHGRASVMYDMPRLVTRLAFGNGYRWLSLALSGLALLLLLGLLVRALILGNPRLRLEAGCPRCGEQELLRIARRSSDRFLHRLGFPAYRYRCRHCTWEGMRLSDEGKSVSPGASITQVSRFS